MGKGGEERRGEERRGSHRRDSNPHRRTWNVNVLPLDYDDMHTQATHIAMAGSRTLARRLVTDGAAVTLPSQEGGGREGSGGGREGRMWEQPESNER